MCFPGSSLVIAVEFTQGCDVPVHGVPTRAGGNYLVINGGVCLYALYYVYIYALYRRYVMERCIRCMYIYVQYMWVYV